jgi:hypothetical protein
MASLRKFLAVSLTTLSLLAPSLVSLSKPAFAEEIYVDKSCRQNQRLPELDRFVVFYKSEFRANGQSYWLSAARYQDGAAILCISRPNFNQPRPVTEFPIEFISSITKDPKINSVFIVTVHAGNGPAAPITVYRLNLTNPNRPVVSQQRTTRRSRS